MSNEISREASWLFAQDKVGRWLLHVPSGVVGKVVQAFAPGEYRQPNLVPGDASLGDYDNGRVSVSVVLLEDGNSFLADPANFLLLSEHDVLVYEVMVQTLANLVTGIAQTAAKGAENTAATPQTTAAVISAALRVQLRALTPR